MAAVTICSDFGTQENKVCHCFHCFPIYFHEMMKQDAMILVFRILSFKPTFHSPLSLSSRDSLVPPYFLPLEWYHLHIRLSVFLQATMIPVCDSSSTAISIMYSAYKLNKQGDYIQPCRTPFPVWNQSIFPCPVLTVAS